MHPAQPRFYEHIRAFLRRNPPLVRTIAVPARRRIYTIGDDDRRIYFVESGGVKLGVTSDHGRDCLLDVMVAGDLFGESCLTGSHERLETATTVSRTVLKAVAYDDIFPFLWRRRPRRRARTRACACRTGCRRRSSRTSSARRGRASAPS
jgi:signal-transduction protein with cAMP-binding, CBS, and nucleotidyltransferase domain